MKKVYNILTGFLILCMIFHFAFSPLHWIRDKELDGYYKVPEDTKFTVTGYLSRAFQDSTDKYLNYRFGLFPGFTRIHHQIEYSLFGNIQVQDVHRGKNGYLFRYYPNYFAGRHFAEGVTDAYADRYARFKDSLKAAGKNVIWIFTPDKNIVFREQLPDSLSGVSQQNRFYAQLKNSFDKKHIEYIDFNEQAINDKNKYPFAVINKGGVHWTSSYAARCYDSLCRYWKRTMDISISNTFTDKPQRNPWGPDIDIEYAANLLVPLEKENIFFTTVASQSNAKDKKILLIGDSFMHVWMWNSWVKECFSSESEFWYYNREANQLDNTLKRTLDHKNVRESISKFDTFVIVYSAANIEQLDYGFMEDVYTK